MPKRKSSDEPGDIVVFEITRDSECAECGDELWRGRWLRLEGERPLCMSCADLVHLVFVQRGDAALTRAELECLADADARARARERRAEREAVMRRDLIQPEFPHSNVRPAVG